MRFSYSFFVYLKYIFFQDKYEDFYKKCLWKDNPNVSVDEIDIEENMTIEKKPKKSKMIVIKSNSLQIKEEKVYYHNFHIY